jgi:hypothetical protein
MVSKKLLMLAVLVLSWPVYGSAQTSQEVNEANNPLTPNSTASTTCQATSGIGMGMRSTR